MNNMTPKLDGIHIFWGFLSLRFADAALAYMIFISQYEFSYTTIIYFRFRNIILYLYKK